MKVRKPVKLSAPQYMDALFDWIDEQVRAQLFARFYPWHDVRGAVRVLQRAQQELVLPRPSSSMQRAVRCEGAGTHALQHSFTACCISCHMHTGITDACQRTNNKLSRGEGVQMEDNTLFPKDAGSTFPANFVDVVKRIFKRLFRVYAHIYHTHFVEMCNLKAEQHLNTCFKHFIFFAKARFARLLVRVFAHVYKLRIGKA